jgi:predicted nucleotidyltransferase
VGIFFHPLDVALSTGAKVRILRILVHTESPLSGRQIAALGGTGLLSTQRALRELVAVGVVTLQQTRSQHLYSLNAENELVQDALVPLFMAEGRRIGAAFDAIRAILEPSSGGRPEVLGAYLFGSAARGADTSKSDFDVLVAVQGSAAAEAAHDALSAAAPEFFSRFGLRLSPVVLEIDTLRRMHAEGDPLPLALVEEGRRILGPHPEELLEW